MNKTALAIRHVAFEGLSDPALQAADLLLVLATQFHIEATAQGLERWFIGHALEIATTWRPGWARRKQK